jgi:type IV pilus assembly protein PilY1
MKSKPLLVQSTLAMALSAGAIPMHAVAAPLLLNTAPAGTDHKPPAPNVIVSVDNAGRMASGDIEALRNALAAAFSETQVPGGTLRLAWQASADCDDIPGIACENLNGMKVLDVAHRKNFMNWVQRLELHSDRPAHRMLRHAGEYLKKPIDIDSAWASVPGKAREPVLDCRRAYDLFVSDGGRNEPVPRTESTLSDLASHYWATDLQPTLADNVKPRNDPAKWRRMTIHTIGLHGAEHATELSRMALDSGGKFVPVPNPASESLVAAFNDILGEIVSERVSPITSLSVSSRSARLGPSLFAAGYDAAQWTGHVTGYKISAGTAALEPGGLWGTDAAAQPNSTATLMDAKDETWPSSRLVLSASTASKNAAAVGISWEWVGLPQSAKDALKTVGGLRDERGSLADDAARDRMAYLRGDRGKEQSRAPGGPFRNRGSRHGDIVNSKLWYLAGPPASAYAQENYAAFRAARSSRQSMLYVGANDGMLHGFDAATGEEKIAYVPEGLNERLVELTRPTYSHGYYVDGSPLTGDLYLGMPGSNDATQWRTYLAGFLGAGGKGYFLLDVTDPAAFTAANAATLVVADKTAAVSMDADIGHIFSEPVMEASDPSISRQITRMNDGRWALVMGNGYNSTSEKAVLLIQYLDGDKKLRKIGTGDAADNGLSAPRLIDLNGDRIPDIAYAGDLLGNFWKFDLSAPAPSDWRVAFAGSPLFVAQDAAGVRQPITSAPVWKAHPDGGLMLAFGTGRNVTVADRTDSGTQTVYGIHDDTTVTREREPNPLTGSGTVTLTRGSTVAEGRSQLVAQTVGTASTTAETGDTLWTVSSNPVPYSGSDPRRGWFLDLPVAHERALQNPGWFGGDLIDIVSTVPATGESPGIETCAPFVATARGYRTILNIVNGSAPKSRIYAEASGSPVTSTAQASRVEARGGVDIQDGEHRKDVGPPGMPVSPPSSALGKVTLRPSWRQLQ